MHPIFSELHDYLSSFIRKFDIIYLGETWLNASDNLDLFQLFGYKMVHIYRTKKKGGDVAIYISNNINFMVLDELCYNLDNVLECVSVQVSISHKKTIIICCSYKQPNEDIEATIGVMNRMSKNKQ